MEMVDLKLSKQEMKEKEGPGVPTQGKPEGPRYPYGTRIELDNEVMDRCNMELSEYEIGDTVVIHAQAKVTSLSMDKSDYENKERKRMSLQITHLGIESGGDEEEEMDDTEESDMDWDAEKSKVDKVLKRRE